MRDNTDVILWSCVQPSDKFDCTTERMLIRFRPTTLFVEVADNGGVELAFVALGIQIWWYIIPGFWAVWQQIPVDLRIVTLQIIRVASEIITADSDSVARGCAIIGTPAAKYFSKATAAV